MTIDERIEALTQSVELLAHMHRDLEQKRAARMEAMDARLVAFERDMNTGFVLLGGTLQTVAKSIEKLTLIVMDHEARIKSLEAR